MHSQTTVGFASCLGKLVEGRRDVVVVPNMGNSGDALINHAVYATLRRQRIRFRVQEAAHGEIAACDASVYVVLTNGALHGPRNRMDDVIDRLNNTKANVILASTTICDREALLRDLRSDVVIMAREDITHSYVRMHRPDLRCILSEDATMAIADGEADPPRRQAGTRAFLRGRTLLKCVRSRQSIGYALAPLRKRTTLCAMRTDLERTGDPPRGSVDLSHVISVRRMSPTLAQACASFLLDAVRACDEVVTNRLHVAIACGLVGARCILLENSYFKNRAVYRHSLERRFAHVTFSGGDGLHGQ